MPNFRTTTYGGGRERNWLDSIFGSGGTRNQPGDVSAGRDTGFNRGQYVTGPDGKTYYVNDTTSKKYPNRMDIFQGQDQGIGNWQLAPSQRGGLRAGANFAGSGTQLSGQPPYEPPNGLGRYNAIQQQNMNSYDPNQGGGHPPTDSPPGGVDGRGPMSPYNPSDNYGNPTQRFLGNENPAPNDSNNYPDFQQYDRNAGNYGYPAPSGDNGGYQDFQSYDRSAGQGNAFAGAQVGGNGAGNPNDELYRNYPTGYPTEGMSMPSNYGFDNSRGGLGFGAYSPTNVIDNSFLKYIPQLKGPNMLWKLGGSIGNLFKGKGKGGQSAQDGANSEPPADNPDQVGSGEGGGKVGGNQQRQGLKQLLNFGHPSFGNTGNGAPVVTTPARPTGLYGGRAPYTDPRTGATIQESLGSPGAYGPRGSGGQNGRGAPGPSGVAYQGWANGDSALQGQRFDAQGNPYFNSPISNEVTSGSMDRVGQIGAMEPGGGEAGHGYAPAKGSYGAMVNRLQGEYRPGLSLADNQRNFLSGHPEIRDFINGMGGAGMPGERNMAGRLKQNQPSIVQQSANAMSPAGMSPVDLGAIAQTLGVRGNLAPVPVPRMAGANGGAIVTHAVRKGIS